MHFWNSPAVTIRVYTNSYCSCSFEPEIIKIGQSSHKMYGNNILNFQEATTILNACTKKVWRLIEYTKYIYIYIYIYIYLSIYIYIYIDIYICVCVCVCVCDIISIIETYSFCYTEFHMLQQTSAMRIEAHGRNLREFMSNNEILVSLLLLSVSYDIYRYIYIERETERQKERERKRKREKESELGILTYNNAYFCVYLYMWYIQFLLDSHTFTILDCMCVYLSLCV